jgi:hypothetical protein
MSVKLKDALALLDTPADLIEGLEKGEKTVDDLKGFIQSNYINRAMAPEDKDLRAKVAGRALGGISTFLKSEAGFDNTDVKDLKPEDIFLKYKAKVEAEIKELKEKQGQPADAAIKDWEAKYQKIEKDLNDYKSMAATNLEGWNTEKANAAKQIKSFKLGNIIEGAKSKITFKDGISQIEKEGFESYISKNYKIDLNDNDEVEIYTSKGDRVKTDTGNQFMKLDDLFLTEAKKNNLLKLNNTPGAAAIQNGGSNFDMSQYLTASKQSDPRADRMAHLAARKK